ncbi:NUMOD1 domain-containing DNA-binding protein [Flavobacterium sp. NG2]|uniref:NUMOD1 domain-containing DNA-binding protein n=1 Tax=Flavobacterium sp. NG2 TaxID=3097547 RepID=UPI002A82B2C6|nr:NUMOD1 domain-containing DNA-binding protein [Flavobacterium sp. NG2]WPR72339.1 NUMOD1 domain-containing DNA-binding protein [Flavobacterium sp. NG2]
MENKNYIIYKAQNTISGECYIGATTKSLEERKQDHIQKANKKVGSYFQEAIGTYGPEAFTWQQLDTASNPNELAEKETMYIYDFKALEEGYNGDCGGGFQKLVYQYNENGILIETYNSLTEIKETLGIDKRRISSACLNSTMYDGCFWSYRLLEKIIPKTDFRVKAVNQYSLNQEFIETFKSASEASRLTGISKTCIARCCRAERKSSGGFIWNYI